MTSSSQFDHGVREDIWQILNKVFSNSRAHSVSLLKGGKTNSNMLVRIENCEDPFVLRLYRRGPSVSQKETVILQTLRDIFPVPEVISAGTAGDVSGQNYILYRYIPGVTFREIRESGTSQDMADAASMVGRCLSDLGSVDWSSVGGKLLLPTLGAYAYEFESPIIRDRLGAEDCLRLQELHSKWMSVLHSLPSGESVMHGDFNHGNILLSQVGGAWKVTGVLDWELAGKGSYLWDAARFMCYEKPDSHWWEEAFVAVLGAGSHGIPKDWTRLSRVLNMLSAAKSLGSQDLQEGFVQELKLLVKNGLRGKRLG